jgi:hypothetical protein
VIAICCFAICVLRSYNAEGGGGTGTVQQLGNNKLQLTFDAPGEPQRLSISGLACFHCMG